MDGLCRALGSPTPVKLKGKTYLMRPLTLGMLGIIENAMLSMRKLPIERIMDLPFSRGTEKLLVKAKRDMKLDPSLRTISIGEMDLWMNTASGMIFSTWLTLREDYAEFKFLENFQEFFCGLEEKELKELARRRNLVSAFGVLANLDWPSSKDEEGSADPISWKKVLRFLGEDRHYSRRNVEDMTFYQLQIQTAKNLGGNNYQDPEEALPEFLERHPDIQVVSLEEFEAMHASKTNGRK